MLICGKESRKREPSLCSFRAGIILKRWGIPLQRFGISSVVNQLIVQNLYLHVECFHPLGEDGSEGLWHILRSPNGLRDCRQRWRRGIWRICSISKRASDGDKKTGRTAVWIGRSCNPSYRAAVCRIFATLRGIVKRLFPRLSPGVSAWIPWGDTPPS